MRTRALLQIGAPLVAVATLMLGLRIGAKGAMRAAVLYGAPASKPGPDGLTRVAWQMVTFLDEREVRETIAIRGLTVTARAHGEEARWTGATNVDGIAEVNLAFHGLEATDAVDVEVRAEGDPEPLARGRAAPAPRDLPPRDVRDGGVRPTSRTGTIGLEVVIEEGRLIPGFPSSVWVRATPPLVGLPITVRPEPGLRADRESLTTCEGGWAEARLTAEAHVVGGGFEAKYAEGAEDANGNAKGTWFGAMPVAAGAFFVSTPRRLEAGKENVAVLIAPNPRHVVYAEIDDERGRAFAGALAVETEPGDPVPRARFTMPPLASGLHWLVVSGEPRGAEELGGVTIAKPLLVGEADGVSVQNACSLGPWLARRQASGFPRWLALDGVPDRSRENQGRRRIGLLVSLLSLAAAGLLEVLLLVASARETRVAMQLAELDETDASVTARSPGGSIAIAALLAVLGFALLAVLLFVKA